MGDKLYWRTKKDGKWTWKAVTLDDRVTLFEQWSLGQWEEEE